MFMEHCECEFIFGYKLLRPSTFLLFLSLFDIYLANYSQVTGQRMFAYVRLFHPLRYSYITRGGVCFSLKLIQYPIGKLFLKMNRHIDIHSIYGNRIVLLVILVT